MTPKHEEDPTWLDELEKNDPLSGFSTIALLAASAALIVAMIIIALLPGVSM